MKTNHNAMKKAIFLFTCLVVLCAAAFTSCSGAAGSSGGKDDGPVGYLMYRTSGSGQPCSVAELEKTSNPYLLYVMPDKGCALQISGLETSEKGSFCYLDIYTWDERDGVVTAEPLKTGKTKKVGGDVEMADSPYGAQGTYTYERVESPECEVALRGRTKMLGMTMHLVESDSAAVIVEALLADPHFAAVKDFIDTCKPAEGAAEAASGQEEAAGPEADNTGIKGVVKLGDRINSWPKAVAGLYDKVSVEKEYNEMEDTEVTQITFSLDGHATVTAMSFEGKQVDYIEIQSEAVTMKAGGKAWKVGGKTDGLEYNSEYDAYECDGVRANADVSGKIVSFAIGSSW